jgi:D-tyrosyl-tRNA(Tyr) deacylase
VAELAGRGLKVATGQFQASMLVEQANDGPVTMLLDSDRLF